MNLSVAHVISSIQTKMFQICSIPPWGQAPQRPFTGWDYLNQNHWKNHQKTVKNRACGSSAASSCCALRADGFFIESSRSRYSYDYKFQSFQKIHQYLDSFVIVLCKFFALANNANSHISGCQLLIFYRNNIFEWAKPGQRAKFREEQWVHVW